jgi:hypothetical protein
MARYVITKAIENPKITRIHSGIEIEEKLKGKDNIPSFEIIEVNIEKTVKSAKFIIIS